MPPEAKDVAKLMNELIQWIQDNHTQIDPIILACIVHHSILLIHPYIDGNGRLSRFVQLLILWNKGFGTYKIYSLDTECEKHLQAYYDAIMIGHNRYTVNTVDGT
jgi:Fic family protein